MINSRLKRVLCEKINILLLYYRAQLEILFPKLWYWYQQSQIYDGTILVWYWGEKASAGERKKEVEGGSGGERRQNPHVPLWKISRLFIVCIC